MTDVIRSRKEVDSMINSINIELEVNQDLQGWEVHRLKNLKEALLWVSQKIPRLVFTKNTKAPDNKMQNAEKTGRQDLQNPQKEGRRNEHANKHQPVPQVQPATNTRKEDSGVGSQKQKG